MPALASGCGRLRLAPVAIAAGLGAVLLLLRTWAPAHALPPRPDEPAAGGADGAVAEVEASRGSGSAEEAARAAWSPGEAWRPGEVPSPYEHPERCGLAGPGPLCDPNGFLTAEGRGKVANVMAAIREKTRASCPDGVERSFEVGAAVVRSMHSETWLQGTKEARAGRFAQELGDSWGVGDAGCENGILLFLSIKDRVAYVKTAPTSRAYLTDRLATVVVENMKPLLRSANYDDAVLQAVLQIYDVLQGNTIPGSSRLKDWLPWAIVLGLVGIYLLPVVLMGSCGILACLLLPFARCLDGATHWARARCARRNQRMVDQDLQRVQEELDRDEFDQSMCPICLEAFETPLGQADTAALECGHRFHRRCIDPWTMEHASCPLCRADVQAPLAPEDLQRPQEYQRRLRFYLSRLQHRHPGFLSGSESAEYRRTSGGRWIYCRDVRGNPEAASAYYASSLQARYERAMAGSRAYLSEATSSSSSSSSGARSGGGRRSFGGGSGFSRGGGGGGGW